MVHGEQFFQRWRRNLKRKRCAYTGEYRRIPWTENVRHREVLGEIGSIKKPPITIRKRREKHFENMMNKEGLNTV